MDLGQAAHEVLLAISNKAIRAEAKADALGVALREALVASGRRKRTSSVFSIN